MEGRGSWGCKMQGSGAEARRSGAGKAEGRHDAQGGAKGDVDGSVAAAIRGWLGELGAVVGCLVSEGSTPDYNGNIYMILFIYIMICAKHCEAGP